MTHDTPEALVRRGYDAFARGDVDSVGDLFADDVVWHVPGRNLIAGDYQGKEAVLEYFRSLASVTDGTFSLTLTDVVATRDRAVGFDRVTGRRKGVVYDEDELAIFRIENGKVVEGWDIFPNADAADAFFG